MQKWRIVTPFFGLNKLLNCRANLMPRVVEIMVAIAKKKWFTKLDLAQAFFQIPVSKKSRPYLAITASGFPLAQYRALPMGLPSLVQYFKESCKRYCTSFIGGGLSVMPTTYLSTRMELKKST